MYDFMSNIIITRNNIWQEMTEQVKAPLCSSEMYMKNTFQLTDYG